MSSFKPAARRVVSGGSKAATADRNNNNNNNAATASSAAAPGSTSAPQNGSVISYGQEFGPGVKAGAGGSVLSIGLNDLDRLFGGGVPLGSLIILYEDAWGEHAATLLKYFMAEGLACRQQLLHLHDGGKPRGLLDALPKLLPAAGESSSAAKAASAAAAAPETELKIAWQYKRYSKSAEENNASKLPVLGRTTQPLAAPQASAWAHRFDISKRMQDDVLLRCESMITAASCAGSDAVSTLHSAAAAFAQRVSDAAAGKGTSATPSQTAEAALPELSPLSVGRIAVHRLGSAAWHSDVVSQEQAEQDVVRSVLQLKARLVDSRCAAMVTVPIAAFSSSLEQRLTHLAHIALHVQSVTDDAELVRLSTEPQSCCGLVRVVKFAPPALMPLPVAEPMLLMVCCGLGACNIRHRRTRLAVVPIEIDPDAEMAQADAEASLTSSAATMLCAQPPGKADVDF